jgi:hypothetical protein
MVNTLNEVVNTLNDTQHTTHSIQLRKIVPALNNRNGGALPAPFVSFKAISITPLHTAGADGARGEVIGHWIPGDVCEYPLYGGPRGPIHV